MAHTRNINVNNEIFDLYNLYDNIKTQIIKTPNLDLINNLYNRLYRDFIMMGIELSIKFQNIYKQ